MASLIYSMIASLDGYIADEDGKFDWAEPDEEVHTFVNNQERGGRRRFAGGMVHLRYRTVGTSP
jgi:dihydrofolate reductase